MPSDKQQYKTPTDNQVLQNLLPDLAKQLQIISDDANRAFEDKLQHTANKALDELDTIINNGDLALDPEQLVKATQVLTKGIIDIRDSRRRLIETIVKCQVMAKAVESPKDKDNDNLLQEYLKANALTSPDVSGGSVFAQIAEEDETNDQ